MKTLTEKVADAAQFINFYDKEDKPQEAKESFIWDCLEQLGINKDDMSHELLMSNDCKEGDFRTVFCDKMKLAVPRFRRVWRILKAGSKEEVAKEQESQGGLTKELIEKITPVGQYSDKQLLEKYSPTCDSKIETELKTRSELRPCIVFKDNSKEEIDVELSAKLLREARRRETPNVYKNNGKVYKVYRIGEFPEQVYTRCPVTGHILFEGYSEQLGVTWEIPYDAMQFVALMVRSGIQVDAFTVAKIQEEYKKSGLDGLRNMFPKIASDFDELKNIDGLPNLKANLNAKEVVQDPFGRSVRY